jgi:hypothetical protein
MAVIYKEIITRPSVNDMFYFESLGESYNFEIFDFDIDPSDTLMTRSSNPYVATWPLVGLVSAVYENLISWQEILTRRNELRADLKDILTVEFLNNKISTFGSDHLCYLNPFSTTLVSTGVSDTLENFVTSYNNCVTALTDLTEYTITQAKLYNNVVSEVLIIDGVESAFPETITAMKYNGQFTGM